MKEELIKKLSTVIGALNNVSVNGRQNLVNLSGSIAIIEEVIIALGDSKVDVNAPNDCESK